MNSKYENIPYIENIIENGSIEFASIFMFRKNSTGLYAFLKACKDKNCIVTFNNEQLIITPNADELTNIRLLTYFNLLDYPKMGDDYIRYLGNISEMDWVKEINNEM
ncbi:MAG: hypothetical protein PUE56_04445 [Clostridium sp.]|nr:hypothetical protein [Clostridium sp.]